MYLRIFYFCSLSYIHTEKKLHNLKNVGGVRAKFVLHFGENRQCEKKRNGFKLERNFDSFERSSLDSENIIYFYIDIRLCWIPVGYMSTTLF